ncbi:hypothetical protein HDC90_001482 [Pedobacter sp. AK013]|uniref:hypothetical protein n=1 Tax=Pedobacter sp. AK013 TaxID=2723071 RepID=UPI001611555A|nr:hypothetical protein [Pedobacter sp. AK013]MBB6236867.1 hypothetical protein [Pedobacter sp. AK013]
MTKHFFLIFFVSVICQATYAQVSAPYLSMSPENNDVGAKWQPMHKMPAGNFTLQWLKSGDVLVSYNRNEAPTKYLKETNFSSKDLQKLDKEIFGFRLKGIYLDPEQPPEFYYVIYFNPKMKNSILLELHALLGNVVSATYFSDKKINPFQNRIYRTLNKC